MKKSFASLLILASLLVNAQQNQQLYQMHYLAESNFLNPAIQNECKIFVGLPLISSLHVNYANSAFSYRQLVENTSDTTSALLIDRRVNRLGWRSFIGTEIHFTWLALGYKLNDYYIGFSVIEKNNIPVTISRDLLMLPWMGNAPFEGENGSSRGTGVYGMHYREYALGASKKTGEDDYVGIKAKLLFGKLNIALPRSNVTLYTDPVSFALNLEGDIRMNISAPVIIGEEDGRIRDVVVDENASIVPLIFNRKNWGFAIDAGFIHQYNSRVSLSGSVVDLGFIRWRSNLNNLESTEHFSYQGVLADSGNVFESILDSVTFTVSHDPYFTMLPLKMYFGVDYQFTRKISMRALTSAVAYRTKLVPALTLAADYSPFRNFHLVASYSLMYRAFNIAGFGFSLGRGPVQFYAVSDNVIGMIWPLSTKNLNLRFGLNLNFGCGSKEDNKQKYRSAPSLEYCPAYRDMGNNRRSRSNNL